MVESTLNTVEKGVDAVDPLHVFSPNEIPTRLILPEGLLSRTGDAYPIACARTNDSKHDLQVKEKPVQSNELVVEDANTKKPVIIIERTPHQPRQYDIYMASPGFQGQEPCAKGEDLYQRAKVTRFNKDLHVFLEGESHFVYVISKAGLAASYSTKHFIKRFGEKEPVASTHPWQGSSDMLEVQPGEDVLFMYCLAAIANEMIK